MSNADIVKEMEVLNNIKQEEWKQRMSMEYKTTSVHTNLGGIKHDADKIDFALMPIGPMEEVAKVWTFGKKKYSAWNWTKGFTWSRPSAAALRHIFAWMSGQDKDPETGYSHLAHAICCLMMLIEFQATGTGQDDRYVRPTKPTE